MFLASKNSNTHLQLSRNLKLCRGYAHGPPASAWGEGKKEGGDGRVGRKGERGEGKGRKGPPGRSDAFSFLNHRSCTASKSKLSAKILHPVVVNSMLRFYTSLQCLSASLKIILLIGFRIGFRIGLYSIVQ